MGRFQAPGACIVRLTPVSPDQGGADSARTDGLLLSLPPAHCRDNFITNPRFICPEGGPVYP